jgi:hypothetical protein
MSERHSPRRVGTGNPGADDVTNQSAHVISFRSLFQLTAINPAVRPNAKVQLTRMAKKRRNGAPIVAALQPAPFSISAKQRETRQSECPLWVDAVGHKPTLVPSAATSASCQYRKRLCTISLADKRQEPRPLLANRRRLRRLCRMILLVLSENRLESLFRPKFRRADFFQAGSVPI